MQVNQDHILESGHVTTWKTNFIATVARKQVNKNITINKTLYEKNNKYIDNNYRTFNNNCKLILRFHYRSVRAGVDQLKKYGIRVSYTTFYRTPHYWLMNLLAVFFGYDIWELLQPIKPGDLRPIPDNFN